MSRSRKFIRTTIAERLPMLGRLDDKEGPFYAPGSEWFTIYTAKHLAWKQSSAETLRAAGYTVTVDIVER